MSKDSQQSEEVDLGQLFKLIGGLFERFFNFIGKILMSLYDLVLLLLIHFFKRMKWYLGAVVLGLIIGHFLDKGSPQLYGASMHVETNYDSARQVYENISFLNHLADVEKDSIELAKRLNISVSEAAQIRGLSIEPNIDENDKMKLFSDFRAQLDSLTKSTFTYNDYVEGLNEYSFRIHRIEMISENKFITPELNDNLISEIVNNNYLNELKDATVKNLKEEEVILEVQKRKLDSLSDFYLNIRKKESEKTIRSDAGSGTNLYLGEMQQRNLVVDETEVMERRLALDKEKLGLGLEAFKQNYIVKPISKFPAAGYDISKFTDKSKFRFPLVLCVITFLLFIVLGLMKFLNKEEQRLLKKLPNKHD